MTPGSGGKLKERVQQKSLLTKISEDITWCQSNIPVVAEALGSECLVSMWPGHRKQMVASNYLGGVGSTIAVKK
jgi:hypothetical protein